MGRLDQIHMLGKDALYLQSELKLQQLRVAGGSVTEEFGIIGVSLDGLGVMFHGYGVVTCEKEKTSSSLCKL